jgi:hypothetical protein
MVKPATVILHSRADDVVPFANSELVRNSGLPASALVEVGTDHRLADPEPLRAGTREAVRAGEGGGVREGGGRARFVGFPKRYLSDFLVFLDNLTARSLAIISCNLWPYGDIILVRKPNPSSPLPESDPPQVPNGSAIAEGRGASDS